MAVGLIGTARPEDVGALRALAADEAVAPFLAVDTADGLDGAVRAGELLVARKGDAVIGAVRGTAVNHRSRIVAVRALMVAPSARGQGVGHGLLRAVCDRAFAAGMHRIEAEVYGDNAAALACFARAGFRHEGIRRRAYDRRGAWQDGVHLGLLADDATWQS